MLVEQSTYPSAILFLLPSVASSRRRPYTNRRSFRYTSRKLRPGYRLEGGGYVDPRPLRELHDGSFGVKVKIIDRPMPNTSGVRDLLRAGQPTLLSAPGSENPPTRTHGGSSCSTHQRWGRKNSHTEFFAHHHGRNVSSERIHSAVVQCSVTSVGVLDWVRLETMLFHVAPVVPNDIPFHKIIGRSSLPAGTHGHMSWIHGTIRICPTSPNFILAENTYAGGNSCVSKTFH